MHRAIYIETFRSLITQPLESVIGQSLLHVSYWILPFEPLDFSADAPNLTGLYAVSLRFEAGTLEMGWNFKRPMREGYAYHIEASFIESLRPNHEPLAETCLVEIGADQALPWRDALGSPLLSVDVYGFAESPQLIRFVFPEGASVIAIGTSAQGVDLTDGDELLVFANDEWTKAKRTLNDPLVILHTLMPPSTVP